jgi:hypothetical protein
MILPELMSELSLTYTTEQKVVKAVNHFRRIRQVEFLKRGFRFSNELGMYVAPLRFDVVREILMWTKKGQDRMAIFLDNIQDSIREASLHKPAIFKKYQRKLLDACETLGLTELMPDIGMAQVRYLRQVYLSQN